MSEGGTRYGSIMMILCSIRGNEIDFYKKKNSLGTSRRFVLVGRRNKIRDNNDDIALEEKELISIFNKNSLGMMSRYLSEGRTIYGTIMMIHNYIYHQTVLLVFNLFGDERALGTCRKEEQDTGQSR